MKTKIMKYVSFIVLRLSLSCEVKADGDFIYTGSMNTIRYNHMATLLPDGKVLVTGGRNNNSSSVWASAELYVPAAGTWATTSSMSATRYFHTATLLANGKVLVAGGSHALSGQHSSAELYDPATGTWAATGAMTDARTAHQAILLSNGKVLVTGGAQGSAANSALSSAELYDPTTGMWTLIKSMSTARYAHTVTLLNNGKVLVTAGQNVNLSLSSTELYDSLTGMWTPSGSLVGGSLAGARSYHTTTLLPNGKVLVTGGYNNNSVGTPLSTAQLYDPATGIWTAINSMSTARYLHTPTLLPNGKVLISGGSVTDSVSSAELYDWTDGATGTWAATGGMNEKRREHTATLLPNGKVLVTGGWRVSNTVSSTAELYNPSLKIGLIKAIKPFFDGLSVSANYQLQLSANATTFTNYGAAFTATNSIMIYPQYFDVENYDKLYFRLKVSP